MPVKKLDRFFVGLLGVLGADDEGAIECDRELSEVSVRPSGSLSERSKLETRGEAAAVDVVASKPSVEAVFTESASSDRARYESLGARLVAPVWKSM